MMNFVFFITACVFAIDEAKEASAKEMCELDAKVVFRLSGNMNDNYEPENNQNSKILSTFVAVNSSVSAASVLQIQQEGKACFFVCEGSRLDIKGCMIFISSQMSPFAVDGGSMHSVNLTIGTLKPFAPIPRLFCSSFKNSERDGTDSITLRDSSFSSFELASAPFLAPDASCFVKASGLKMTNISIASGAQREMDSRARTETTIEGCSFFRARVNYAGGLRIHQSSGNEDETIEKCKFIRNVAGSFGGGLYMERQSNSYIISECEFEGNLANGTGTEILEGGGGGIRLNSASWMKTEPPPKLISFCLFSGNKAKNEEGHDVKIKNYFLKGSPFESSFSTTPSKRVFYNDSQTDFDSWLFTIKTTFARADGITGPVCGTTQTNPCNTIKQAFNMIEKGAEGTVNILQSTFSSTALFIGGGDITFKGESESECIISTKLLNSHECLFTLHSGSMGLSLVTIRHNSAESSSSLFEMRTGAQKLTLKNVIISGAEDGQSHTFDVSPFKVIFEKMKMENCLIEDIGLGDCSLFEEEEESGVGRGMLGNVTIQRISRMRGDGVIFSTESERSDSWELENNTFRNCMNKEGNGGSIAWSVGQSGIFKIGRGEVTTVIGECGAENGRGDEKGRGGGVYLELSSPSVVFEIVNVGFENNYAEHGVNVFIASNQLELVPKGRYGFISLLSEDVHEVEGMGDTNNATLVIPIVCYLLDVPRSEIYVSASGADHPRCGHTFFECRTLSCPIEREESTPGDGTTTATIKVGNGVEVGSTVIFSKLTRVIEGTGDDGSLVVGGEASCKGDEEGCIGVFVVLKETRMRKIELVIPSVLERHEAIFQLKGETLNLSECVVGFGVGTGVNFVEYSLIVVEKGEANVTSLRLDSMRFGKPVIKANGGLSSVSLKNVELNDMNFEGEKGFAVCEGGSTLTAESVISSDCEMGGSSLIWAGSNCIARMRECSWSSCNFVDSGIIKGVEAKEISIWGCNGSNVRVSEGDGGMTNGVAAEGGFVDVWNTSIEGCVVEKGNGGGMRVELKGDAQLKIRSETEVTLMKKCSAGLEGTTNGGGCGGGLWVGIEGERYEFDLSGMRFEENRARSGMDVFVVCDDLRRVVNGSSFSFSGEIIERENSLSGIDRQKFVSEVDLFIFIDGFSSSVIEVESETGDNGMWCGMEKCPCRSVDYGIGRLGGEGEKKIVISGSTSVEKVGDVSGVRIEGKGNTRMKVVVEKGIEGGGESVLDSKGVSAFVNVGFELPGLFEQRKDVVISSSTGSGVLEMELCSLVMQEGEEEAIEYRIIRSSGQAVRMKWISINNIRTRKYLMDLALLGMEQNGGENEVVSISNCSFESLSVVGADDSAVICGEVRRVMKIEQSNMSDVTGGESMNGGAVRVNILDSGMIHVKEGMMERCAAEKVSGGKGGWLYVNCSERRGGMPFKFEGVKFAENEAFVGKNMFILDSDLNATVRSETFAIDVEEMEDDPNEFVGSDEKRMSTDLLRFVIEYRSERIVVWEKGDDVVRCGSEEDPCETLEMGLKHIEREGERKVVGVKEKIRVEGEHDLSGIDVESVGAGYDEIEYGTVVMGSEGESGAKVCLRNSGAFILRTLEMCVMNVLGSVEAGMIVSEGGKIEWEDCSVTWKGKREGMGNVAFCVVKKGELEMKRFKVLSYFGKRNVFVVGGEVVSVIDEFTVIEATLEKGSLFEIEGEGANGGGEMRMKNCSIGSVEGEGADPSVVSSKSGSGVKLVVEDSLIEGCSCGRSTKGGAMLFELNEGGWFDVVNTSVKQCGCSVSEGKGGGVYLKTELRGELDYVFDGVIFRRNTAFIGNDVFIVCDCIERQINETQFNLDFRDVEFIRQNAIYGMDAGEHKEEAMDLMSLIVKYQSDTIVVSSKEGKGGSNEQQCGKPSLPCATIGFGLRHLTHDFLSQMVVDEESVIDEEIGLDTLTLSGMHEVQSRVVVKGRMNCSKEMIVETNGQVYVRWIQFAFEEVESTPTPLPTTHSLFMKISSGKTSISMCSFEGVSSAEREMVEVPFSLIFVERGKCSMGNVSVLWLSFLSEAAMIMEEDTEANGLTLRNIEGSKGCLKISEAGNSRMEKGWMGRANGDEAEMKNRKENEFSFSILSSSFENITCADESAGVVDVEGMEGNVEFSNCSFGGCSSRRKKGKMISLLMCKNIQMRLCLFDGKEERKKDLNEEVDVCKWNGSVVEVKESSGEIRDTSFVNCSDGGLSIWRGSVEIEKGEFMNNNPSIEKYPSARRNILCSDSGVLNVVSLKGGDGVLPNTSLWILNEGCEISGIVSERLSSFFIPELGIVEMEEMGAELLLRFKGKLLLPCNISFKIVKQVVDEDVVERYEFNEEGCVSENEVDGKVPIETINNAGEETEVSVSVLFGKKESPSSTESFILKNRSETQGKKDEKLVEGGKEGKSYWLLIVIALVVILLIVLIGFILFVVRWKKVKNEAEDLREIVNDNIRKDPKAFEMVTMEMSPEEQWRRAEREAEKKSEERMKKRVYERNMEHSESSEHLLSESGSTEYILGRDSDKIPEWALEKVDEKEEEIRKRTPSPSISSISSTSTTDSDSTFVRGEDLCPTTSSMSNLVDAMACSSPHEKLIVDLRDSLFMLLHGRNEKKEMAIGSLKEREQTAAQILFWVANGALHSFDEEKELPSLANLSPHIVLFSEHMVICIALHSDCSSSDDSDSSSICSMSIVSSSSSNISVMSERFTDSPPRSSAFEDCEDNRKECLRWKAPELLMNKKMGATKESVAFSIGMMVWECLTLDIPFGEYEAEVAGDKISKGERPNVEKIRGSELYEVVWSSMGKDWNDRPTLSEMKREFYGHFPAGAVIVTMSDAICERGGESTREGEGSFASGEEGYSTVFENTSETTKKTEKQEMKER
ncbi:uncharacterized protein MONOS_15505 [Monocercomonoides exilis]|uniref:uncharacterized protein n=1 Tax=Monocercomonoides exilis TaxID=2049356 RepID=UPI00355ABB7C|nr:hypothetical protein MONOS_15505 [Monocercomonoides exilis]